MKTVFTSSGLTPARCKAAWIAVAPSLGAGTDDSEPRKAPIGVRAAPTITTFFPWAGIGCSSRGGTEEIHNPDGPVKPQHHPAERGHLVPICRPFAPALTCAAP